MTAALQTAQTVKAVWAVVDLGIGTFNLVTDPNEDVIKAKYPDFYRLKTAINIAYAVSRPVAEMQMAMNEAITSGDKIIRDAETTAEEVRIMKEELRALRMKAGLSEEAPEEIPVKPIPESLLAEREAELRKIYGPIYDNPDFRDFRQLLMDDIYIQVIPITEEMDKALKLIKSQGAVRKDRVMLIATCDNIEYRVASSFEYTNEMRMPKNGFLDEAFVKNLGKDDRIFDVTMDRRYYDAEAVMLEYRARSRGGSERQRISR